MLAAMWGIHDRQLILRKELHETLTKASYKDALYRRWRYQQTMSNKQVRERSLLLCGYDVFSIMARLWVYKYL